MSDLTKNNIRFIQSLKNKKDRDEHGVFVAEGNKMVSELLQVMKCKLLVATTDFIRENKSILKDSQIEELIEISKKELERISFLKNPQQVLAVFFKPTYDYNIDSLKGQLSLVLDGIQDPGNMGTIIRLADWYGIEDIFCSPDTVDVFNTKVVQATMGALSRVKIHYLDLADFLKSISECLPIYGTFLDGKNMYKSEIKENGLIVMGNEGNGIRPNIEAFITHKLFIPNYPIDRQTSESLNVSIATAIVCSEFRRQSIK